MSRTEVSRRNVNGMTLNDDRHSGEWKRPSESSVTVMGKLIRLKERGTGNA